MSTDAYSIRYFGGKTVRVYDQEDGLVSVGDCVVMDKKRPVARFFSTSAVEIFCRDYEGKEWMVVNDPQDRFNPTQCPMCHNATMAIVVKQIRMELNPEKICRKCGYHTGHLKNGTTEATVEDRGGP